MVFWVELRTNIILNKMFLFFIKCIMLDKPVVFFLIAWKARKRILHAGRFWQWTTYQAWRTYTPRTRRAAWWENNLFKIFFESLNCDRHFLLTFLGKMSVCQNKGRNCHTLKMFLIKQVQRFFFPQVSSASDNAIA